jgi:hypothetical protein
VADYRAQLWINCYQFGKYINNIGPQTSYLFLKVSLQASDIIANRVTNFEGILDYYGQNWLAVEIWAQLSTGAQLTNFGLEAGMPVWTSIAAPGLAPIPSYSQRPNAY